MKIKALWSVGLLAVLTGAAGAYGLANTQGEASKGDARIDCPGKIVCPITRELICSDECPVGDQPQPSENALPACCQSK